MMMREKVKIKKIFIEKGKFEKKSFGQSVQFFKSFEIIPSLYF